MKRINTLMMMTAMFSIITLQAQNDLQREQFFNRDNRIKPYIGLDRIRAGNPLVIIQTIPAASPGSLVNRDKYTTAPAGFGANMYTELGHYIYDTTSKIWNVDMVSQYKIDYSFQKKAVMGADIQQLYYDVTDNNHFQTHFDLDGISKPLAEHKVAIIGPDTSFYSSNDFYYDSLHRLAHVTYKWYTGISTETSYTYDANGRLSGELVLTVPTQFAVPDTSYKTTYTYDSFGKLTGYLYEAYKLTGSPHEWTVITRISYEYGLAPDYFLKASHVFACLPTDNYNEAPVADHEYTYSSMGKLTEYVETNYQAGQYLNKHKLVIFYDADNNADYGFQYDWDGAVYKSFASYRYEFGQDITGIPAIAYEPRQLIVYPNPVQETLHLPKALVDKEISIADMQGSIVYHDVPASETLDVTQFSKGIYIIIAKGYKPGKWIKS